MLDFMTGQRDHGIHGYYCNKSPSLIFYYSCQVRGMERITESYTLYSANLVSPQLTVENHIFGRHFNNHNGVQDNKGWVRKDIKNVPEPRNGSGSAT